MSKQLKGKKVKLVFTSNERMGAFVGKEGLLAFRLMFGYGIGRQALFKAKKGGFETSDVEDVKEVNGYHNVTTRNSVYVFQEV